MIKIGELLLENRKAKNISLGKVAQDLHIKEANLAAVENSDWANLPEPAFVKGFIKSYSEYLDLDAEHALALYRREVDETKYPKKEFTPINRKHFFFTPNRIVNSAFIIAILIFISYLLVQYFSVLKSPKIDVSSPPDDLTTSIPIAVIAGKTEREVTVSVNGEFIPVDQDGNFTYQYKLDAGQNIIEIIAAKRLSPKTKLTKIVRLTS